MAWTKNPIWHISKQRRLNLAPRSSQAAEMANYSTAIARSSGSSSSSSSPSISRGASPSSISCGASPIANEASPVANEDKRRETITTIKREMDLVDLADSRVFSAGPVGEDILDWEAHLIGPLSIPFSGGAFFLSIQFPPNYPDRSPRVTFKVKDFFHPNISENGDIGLQILETSKWTPFYDIF